MLQAVTTYVTLILAGRLLSASEFGGLAALYILVSSIATGLFLPLEQEVTRRRGREWETGRTDGTLLRRAFLFGLCLCVLVVAIILAAYDGALRLLGQHPQLLAALCLALPGYALCFVSRGALSGSRRLTRYALQLSVEGVFRLCGLAVLAALGINSASAYGWLFAFAPWIAWGTSVAGVKLSIRSELSEHHAPRLVGPLTLLLTGSLAAQLLIGAGPITAQVFAQPGDQARIGAFLAALVVVRVPVFLFAAVQPSMLPTMSAHAVAGRRSDFKSLLAKVFGWMGLLVVATTLGTAVLGPWGLTFLFGPGYRLSREVFLLLGVAVGLYLVSGLLAQGVLALGNHRSVTAAWIVGVAGLALGTVLGEDAVIRATMGLMVGTAASAATFCVLFWYSLRQWNRAEDGGD